MTLRQSYKALTALCVIAAVAGCGRGTGNSEGVFGGQSERSTARSQEEERTSIWDVLRPSEAGTQVKVNKYLWAASLEVLDFLPVESVDPFTGVISTGYGTPPGGGRSYRATVLIRDPALDARSLNVALQTRGGRAVNAATQRAVEDAILARARQLRVGDNRI